MWKKNEIVGRFHEHIGRLYSCADGWKNQNNTDNTIIWWLETIFWLWCVWNERCVTRNLHVDKSIQWTKISATTNKKNKTQKQAYSISRERPMRQKVKIAECFSLNFSGVMESIGVLSIDAFLDSYA